MPNMSYCKFQNTLSDLYDCKNSLNDVLGSEKEHTARQNLFDLCREIADSVEQWHMEDYEEED